MSDLEYKLYTLDEQFIGETDYVPFDFTGISINTKPDRKAYYKNGKYHRLNGPAIDFPHGTKIWFIDDKQVTEKQHKLLVDIMKLKGLI